MDMIALSDQIKKTYGLNSAKISLDEKDLIIILTHISLEKCIFMSSYSSFDLTKAYMLIFMTNKGEVCIPINILSCVAESYFFIVETVFSIPPNHPFFQDLIEFTELMEKTNTRKEKRILCTAENLAALRLSQKISFSHHSRSFFGYIKDLSFSSLRVLIQTNGEAFDETTFHLKLDFFDPTKRCVFTTSFMRKIILELEGIEFTELVFSIPDDIFYKTRLVAFFENQAPIN